MGRFEGPTSDTAASIGPRVQTIQEVVPDHGIELFEFDLQQASVRAPLQASRFIVNPGCETVEDKHAVSEIWFIGSGAAEVYYDGQPVKAVAGDALYFAPWKPHKTRNVGTEQLLIFSVWWS
ncbi:cupin domain-containing protein [Acidisphaera sp. S103]|uniref:cupin domain-containing protein n=1 Tax=Acidisphaera sp. S103 TaxID=1747223 RepID=UPI00131A76DC